MSFKERSFRHLREMQTIQQDFLNDLKIRRQKLMEEVNAMDNRIAKMTSTLEEGENQLKELELQLKGIE